MPRSFLCLIPIFIIIVISCSGTPDFDIPEEIASLDNLIVIPADAQPLHAIELERAAVYGDNEDVIIGRLGMSTVDENGRVYLADVSQSVIHIFEPDGSYIAKIGGEGDGPGEFRQIRSLQVQDDKLYVMDMNNLRISTFDLNTLQFTADTTIPFEYDFSGGFSNFPQLFYLHDQEHFIIHFGVNYSTGESDGDEPTVFGKLINRESGELSDKKLYELPAGEVIIRREGSRMSMMGAEYKRHPKIIITGRNMIQTWTEDLLFSVYEMDGSYSHALYHPEEKVILNRNDVLDKHADRSEPWRSMIRNDVMPETWPAFSDALADDEGRIWAALFDDDDEIWNWRVFTLEGELFASFNWSRDKQIRDIRNGYVYTRETDEETGLQKIVKYDIELF